MPKLANTLIPLLCDLCPKKPRFSDVSHLLTHISSKSHLSNRFKLQIRSQTEPEAKRLLVEFDSWYANNGLEDLLSERLAAKDQKKTTKRTRLPSIPVSVRDVVATVAGVYLVSFNLANFYSQVEEGRCEARDEIRNEG